MATSTIILGSLPVMRGAYDNTADYFKANEVILYGMTFRAKVGTVESPLTGYPPAQLVSDEVSLINTDKWDLTSGTPENYSFTDNVEALKRALGFSSEAQTIVLTAGETGKYVKCSTRAAAADANFNISAPFDVDACTELLIKTGYNPSDNDHAALDISVIAIYEQLERIRTVQKKNGNNEPLYYVVIIDPETGQEVVTSDETTTNTGYPVYIQETYTETRYLPNNEDRFVKIPDSGYYVANIPQSCKCVVSYKPGVTDLNVIAVKYGALANLTSQLLDIYAKRTIAEAFANLEERILAIEKSAGKLGAATAGSLDVTELTTCLYPLVLRGHGVPAAATIPDNLPEGLPWDGIPAFPGQIYINLDAASGGLYYAIGTSDVAHWINA